MQRERISSPVFIMERIPHMHISWGNLKDGRPASLYRITSPSGEYAQISDYGATLVSLYSFDRSGVLDDVVLGYGSVREYEENPKNAGATVGRYANRIAYGAFPLEGRTVHVSCNRPPHCIHGGEEGFDKKLWTVVREEEHLLALAYVSPDGEEGFPGTLRALAVFDFSVPHRLEIRYEAETDAATVCSMTCHAYWNLGGHASGRTGCERQRISVRSEAYAGQSAEGIPTGELIPVAGTAFDLNGPKTVGELITAPELLPTRGIDHAYALAGDIAVCAATAEDPVSGRTMKLYTNMPAVQVYLGGNLPAGLRGRDGAVYGPHCAFCMETEHFPDAPNHETLPSPVLRPGERAVYRTVLDFSTEA